LNVSVPPTITIGDLLGLSPGLRRGFMEMVKTKRVSVGEPKRVADVPAGITISAPVVLREPSYSSPLPRVRVNINGASTIALIDTGSEINIITEEFQELAGIPVNTDLRISTKGIHGQAGQSLGCCESVAMKFGNIVTLGHYHMFPTALFDILCGQPFLKNHLSMMTEDGSVTKMTLKDFYDENKKVTLIVRPEGTGMRRGGAGTFVLEAMNEPLTAREYFQVTKGAIEEIEAMGEDMSFDRRPKRRV
jgi:hypothetical protein